MAQTISTMTFGVKPTQKRLERILKDGNHSPCGGGKCLAMMRHGKSARSQQLELEDLRKSSTMSSFLTLQSES